MKTYTIRGQVGQREPVTGLRGCEHFSRHVDRRQQRELECGAHR